MWKYDSDRINRGRGIQSSQVSVQSRVGSTRIDSSSESEWGWEMKIKVAVPNSRTSSTSKAEARTESESTVVSVDERSTVVSSPVIKVYGSLERVALEERLELEL